MVEHNRLLCDDDAKWKPRNKQAALIVRPAQWINLPPAAPRFLKSEQERIAEIHANNEKSLAAAKERGEMRDAIVATRALIRGKTKKPKKAKCLWARQELRAIHKRKGFPPPTEDQIRAHKKSKAIFGQPIHAQ